MVQGKVYNLNNEDMGTVEIKTKGNFSLAWVWSENIEWLNEVKEKTQETLMNPVKCETCSGYLLTLRRKSVANLYKAYPIVG